MSSAPTRIPFDPFNAYIADLLDEAARLLEEQRANVFRVQAYHSAADTVRALRRGVDDILDAEGIAGLDRLPGIGQGVAHVIDQIVMTGRFPMLERLRRVSNDVRASSPQGFSVPAARAGVGA